jgi:hypothetical protein
MQTQRKKFRRGQRVKLSAEAKRHLVDPMFTGGKVLSCGPELVTVIANGREKPEEYHQDFLDVA